MSQGGGSEGDKAKYRTQLDKDGRNPGESVKAIPNTRAGWVQMKEITLEILGQIIGIWGSSGCDG